MVRQSDVHDNGSWTLTQEYLERGDPAFVDELRRITDADRLGEFALTWYADRRPTSRRLLLDYLTRPLNAFRHEALVKRLFKAAEKAGDDEVMAHFLVLLDRSVRRITWRRHHVEHHTFPDRATAQFLLKQWVALGYEHTYLGEYGGQQHLTGSWSEEVLVTLANSGMWRPPGKQSHGPWPVDDHYRKKLEKHSLFSLPTRKYLRRRAWRYFRRLGKPNPLFSQLAEEADAAGLYVRAVTRALKLYRDDDVADAVALLDNWGLLHILFHHSPALKAGGQGWKPARGHTLAELAPAPIYEQHWRAAPQALIELLIGARCRTVRQWAIALIRRDHPALLADLPLEELFGLLGHESPEVVELAAEVLRNSTQLESLGMDRWLVLLERAGPEALEIVCDLMSARLRPERLTLEQAVRMAKSRPVPVARLGFTWLRYQRTTTESDYRALLGLIEAEAESLRRELVHWARGLLGGSAHFQPNWVLEYLDCRHADVRAEGWEWLVQEPRAKDDVALWQRLLESPYDDVRLKLVSDLEARVQRRDLADAVTGRLESELVRWLWASVLLNIHLGCRVKPLVVSQLVRRLGKRPEEAGTLLPILRVALRSLRGPEWRAGLAGVVQLAERHPELAATVREMFPELKLIS